MSFAKKIKENVEKLEIKRKYGSIPKNKCRFCGKMTLFTRNKKGNGVCVRCGR